MEKSPILYTERLLLELPSILDIPKIVKYLNNPKITDNVLNMPFPYFEKDAVFWLNMANKGWETKTAFIFGIYLQSTKEFIGGVGLTLNTEHNHAELGYWLSESFWNKGYISEAVKAVIMYGFETLELNKIYATHLINNPASGKVMIKNGMKKEGQLISHYKKEENYHTIDQYGITRSDYTAQNNTILI